MFKKVIKEELKIPAEIGYLGDLRDFVTRIGRKFGISESDINSFKIAIDEAGTNIIRHAYRDWEGFITLRILIKEHSVTISLIDQGHAFDPRNVKDPDLQRYVDIGKKGGLGIFIIRRVIDEIDYRKTEEGNELRLTKKREEPDRKRIAVPDIGLSMKTRFHLAAAALITLFVIIGFLYNYSSIEGNQYSSNMRTAKGLLRSVAIQSVEPLRQEYPFELSNIASQFHRNHGPFVEDVVIVDTTGLINGTHRTHLLLKPFSRPQNSQQIEKNVYKYSLAEDKAVYELVNPVIMSGTNIKLGTVHLFINRQVIERAVKSEQRRILTLFIMIFVFGNAGVTLLIYVMMTPFKKLAAWVRDLGQGGAPDEMDFDSGDEVGEIAKAFNEITEKFRKSQENVAEQERLQKEMQVAKEIQQILLPSSFPDIEGFEIASYYDAAKEVGGDYFDFVEVDKDSLGIVVADVSGKGVPGSLVMTMIRTALRTEARGNKNAADVLTRVNDFVINDMKKGMFVTVFYVILDSKKRTINYASAGHNPMVLYRSSTKKSYYLNPRGFPIGISLPDKALFRNSIESDTLRLRKDDVLVVYTDGVTEAMNSRRDQFGDERFLETLRKYGQEQVDPLVEKIHEQIELFTEGFPQNDDITLVAIREKMKAEEVLYNLRSRLMDMVEKDNKTVKEACEIVGVSTSTYYKYKKRFNKMGKEGLKEQSTRSEIEEKHLSIEDKAKILNIIKEYPEYGAKRISEELNNEQYGNTTIDEKRIYEELVRSRLNTKSLRMSFIERGGRRKHVKSPGTPMLTMDGQVIIESKYKKTSDLIESSFDNKPDRRFVKQEKIDEEKSSHIFTPEHDESIINEFLGIQDTENEIDIQEIDQEENIFDAQAGKQEDISSLDIEESETDFVLDDENDQEEDEKNIFEYDPDFYEQDPIDEEILAEIVPDSIESEIDGLKEEDDEYMDAISLDQVLAINDSSFSSFNEEDSVENDILSSVAEELIDEEIGQEKKIKTADLDSEKSEDDFIEMMEDLGFERRTVLSESLQQNRRVSAAAVRENQFQKELESGVWLYKEGMYEKALENFNHILNNQPDNVPALQFAGDTYFRLGDMSHALSAYEKAKQLEPDNTRILENLGSIYANRGEYKKAVWQWGEVLKKNPSRSDLVDQIKKMQRIIRRRYV